LREYSAKSTLVNANLFFPLLQLQECGTVIRGLVILFGFSKARSVTFPSLDPTRAPKALFAQHFAGLSKEALKQNVLYSLGENTRYLLPKKKRRPLSKSKTTLSSSCCCCC